MGFSISLNGTRLTINRQEDGAYVDFDDVRDEIIRREKTVVVDEIVVNINGAEYLINNGVDKIKNGICFEDFVLEKSLIEPRQLENDKTTLENEVHPAFESFNVLNKSKAKELSALDQKKAKEFKWFRAGFILFPLLLAITPIFGRIGAEGSWIIAATPIYLAIFNVIAGALGMYLVFQLMFCFFPFILIYTFTVNKIEKDWVFWTEGMLLFLSTLLFIPFWRSSVEASGLSFTLSLFIFHTLGVAIFLHFVILSIKKKNIELRYAANLVFFCMFILCLFPVGLYMSDFVRH